MQAQLNSEQLRQMNLLATDSESPEPLLRTRDTVEANQIRTLQEPARILNEHSEVNIAELTIDQQQGINIKEMPSVCDMPIQINALSSVNSIEVIKTEQIDAFAKTEDVNRDAGEGS